MLLENEKEKAITDKIQILNGQAHASTCFFKYDTANPC